jgi:hypothetical protein
VQKQPQLMLQEVQCLALRQEKQQCGLSVQAQQQQQGFLIDVIMLNVLFTAYNEL